MKTNKHQTLILVHTKGRVQAKDLVQQFGYSPGTARSYLSYLKRQDLLARTGQGHVFTERGGPAFSILTWRGVVILPVRSATRKPGTLPARDVGISYRRRKHAFCLSAIFSSYVVMRGCIARGASSCSSRNHKPNS